MTIIGTPLSRSATKVLLLGSGELGKEVAIEFQRLGVEVVAVDRYSNAPAMQIAHKNYVINMQDSSELKNIVFLEKPNYIVPEIEAISTQTLIDLELEGFTVIPSARATQLTMDREGIRKLASETLNVPTSDFLFADNFSDFQSAILQIGLPCVVKPVMSSSGKGQSLVQNDSEIQNAWDYAISGSRGDSNKVIVESFIDFDYEITLLTIQHKNGCLFCEPIGHRQYKGDYQESWQPQEMSKKALNEAKNIADLVTSELGGTGLFGVEFFVKNDEVFFSELSPRPHDTGMVTLISQDLSEFALHVRAILGLPVSNINFRGPAASSVVLVQGSSENVRFEISDDGLNEPDTQIRLFGKPSVDGERRMGVALALGDNVENAKMKANKVASSIKPVL